MRETAYTVSELSAELKGALESAVGQVWIKGEVSGLKAYQSGHWYFTLRDADAQLRCVMWQTYTRRVKEPPAEGTEVYVLGRPSLWAERGELRLSVVTMLPTSGVGFQQLALEKTRAALDKDGLFALERKRALPPFPRAIAVVTSLEGAALRDIVAVARGRWPAVRLLIIPAKVQGDEAGGELLAALTLVNRLDVDLCLVGRGGGSREDLSAFNLEPVCRAVAAVKVPTVSAVGHETDISLTDLVADARAPTPSAAVVMVLPDRADVARHVGALGGRLAHGLTRRTRVIAERLVRSGDRLQGATMRLVVQRRHDVGRLAGQLELLSPLKLLGRGYSVATLDTGKLVRSKDQVPAGTRFTLRVADGEVPSRAEER
ncbi:MAG: exodeoxyribonuclease VII large subunit [Gemmatimonadota bacterium]